MNRDQDYRREMVEALTLQYVIGEISEPTFVVSLHRYIDIDDIKHIVALNQLAHRNSLPFKRGHIQ